MSTLRGVRGPWPGCPPCGHEGDPAWVPTPWWTAELSRGPCHSSDHPLRKQPHPWAGEQFPYNLRTRGNGPESQVPSVQIANPMRPAQTVFYPVHVCMHVRVHAFVCTHPCAHVCTLVCIAHTCLMHMHAHSCAHAFVCACVPVCACAYPCVHTCVHMCTFVCALCMCAHACMCVFMCTCARMSCACAHSCVFVCVRMYPCVCTHVCMFVCAGVRVHVRVCTHTCMCVLAAPDTSRPFGGNASWQGEQGEAMRRLHPPQHPEAEGQGPGLHEARGGQG